MKISTNESKLGVSRRLAGPNLKCQLKMQIIGCTIVRYSSRRIAKSTAKEFELKSKVRNNFERGNAGKGQASLWKSHRSMKTRSNGTKGSQRKFHFLAGNSREIQIALTSEDSGCGEERRLTPGIERGYFPRSRGTDATYCLRILARDQRIHASLMHAAASLYRGERDAKIEGGSG